LATRYPDTPKPPSFSVDCAKSDRLTGTSAENFFANPRSHDILIEDTGFKYIRLREVMTKMKSRFPHRFAADGLHGVRRAHPKSVFKKAKQ